MFLFLFRLQKRQAVANKDLEANVLNFCIRYHSSTMAEPVFKIGYFVKITKKSYSNLRYLMTGVTQTEKLSSER